MSRQHFARARWWNQWRVSEQPGESAAQRTAPIDRITVMSEQLPCPSCDNPMESKAYPRSLGGEEWLDLCWRCQGIWFDAHESTQLAPASVVALFRQIHENREAARPVADILKCPRCVGRLAYRQDVTKSGRFAYYRCMAEHGRFTPFNQFMIEKGFVRALTNVEIAALKVQIQIVRCSSCGAPIDLRSDTACSHCRAPIAVLDAQAVEKALAAFGEAGKQMPVREHDVVAELILQRERDREEQSRAGRPEKLDPADLIVSSIASIFKYLG